MYMAVRSGPINTESERTGERSSTPGDVQALAFGGNRSPALLLWPHYFTMD
jgi:hypothetical protein